jgi:hypothetical protein
MSGFSLVAVDLAGSGGGAGVSLAGSVVGGAGSGSGSGDFVAAGTLVSAAAGGVSASTGSDVGGAVVTQLLMAPMRDSLS